MLRSATTLLLAGLSIAHAYSQACTPPAETAVTTLPAGTMFEHIGSSDMPITTNNPKVKDLVKQGFALIHCYWPNEAIRTFREATKADPTCATAWCGLNIALTQPWFQEESYKAEAEYAIRKAIQNVDAASEAEQGLIRAFRLRSFGKDERGSDFEREMQTLVDHFPKLDEPRLVWAGIRAQRCMNISYLPNGDIRGDLDFIANIIEPVLKRSPECPGALHYWIHAMEPSSPKRAERAANTLLRVATGSPHLQHMPGHIYNRIGRYDDAHRAFSQARKMDEELAKTLKVQPADADWQYYHNVTFDALNLLEAGRIDESIELAKLTRNAKYDIAVRTRDWKNAYDAQRTDGPLGLLINLYDGRAALDRNDIEGAKKELVKTTDYINKGEQAKPGDTQYRIILCLVKELEGLIAFAEGDADHGTQAFEESLRAFERIEYDEPVILIQTPYESYGHCLIGAKRYNEAVKAFQRGLVQRPNSGWMLYGIALAHEMAGRKKEATAAYRQFMQKWATADASRPEVQRAKSFLGQAQKN